MLWFELRYQFTRPVTWFYLAVFIVQGVFFMGTSGIVLAGGGMGDVARNAPWAIGGAMLMTVTIDQVIVTGIVGTAILRDFQYKAHELVFTSPITRGAYLGGRFAASFTVMVLLHLGIPLGLWLGTLLPWVSRAELQPFSAAPYLVQYLLLVVPTLFFISAVFFAVGALTRSQFAIYAQGIVLLLLWLISRPLLASVGNQRLGAWIDPFGVRAYEVLTRYWTAAEKSAQMIPLSGVVLESRLIWVGVGAVLLALTYATFQFRSAPRLVSRKPVPPAEGTAIPATVGVRPPQRFDTAAWRAQVWSTARLAFVSTIRDVPFVIIAAAGMVTLLTTSLNANSLYGELTWPVTWNLLDGLQGGFSIFFVLLITLYAGEAVWRERQIKLHYVADALPTRSGVSLAGNFLGLVGVEAVLILGLMATGIVIQTAMGYTRYEPGLYLTVLYGLYLPQMIQITALAFLVHVVVNHKYAGHAVMVLLWVGRMTITSFGVEHRLLIYGANSFQYSDLNGFGPYRTELVLTSLYWTGVALLLGVIGYCLWIRGAEDAWRVRLAAVRGRWNRASFGLTGLGVVLAAGAGGTIFYNTNVLHRYRPAPARREVQARYERQFRSMDHLNPPRMVAEHLRVDLEPERRAFDLAGTFVYVNREPTPIDSLLISFYPQPGLRIDTLTWDRPFVPLVSDSVTWTRLDRFETPLAPGDTVRFRYRARFEARGFANDGAATAITANGTFLRRSWFPALGYHRALEVADPDERRRAGLPPAAPMPSRDDPEALRTALFLGRDADWIDFRATVSTAPDQIAVAPGQLVREYRENGRRVFEYTSPRPIANDFSILSARYAVLRGEQDGVRLEILHHPGHDFNTAAMMAAAKASISYYGRSFGPYPFKELRIAEFPRYGQFALGEPGLIPFSESAGFVFRSAAGNDNIDLAFYITAHEVGHQWWGQQVAGADVGGTRWLSEGLANYSALALMEAQGGLAAARKFLGYELDRYLYGRSIEKRRELPLDLVEDQPYIHYNKGSLALYAYKDLIGETAMNQALAGFVAQYGGKGPPYPTSRDLIRHLTAVAPDSVRYAITDLFETITLWDLRTEQATAVRRPDGKYQVTIRGAARKFRVDSLGVQHEVPMADLVDVGVFAAGSGGGLGEALFLGKVWIRDGSPEVTVVVDRPPAQAGIDPYTKLIDRDRRDNVVAVESAGR
jgi:ABC-type transport system involved in multi-copper enzyme maturation permease subunit